MEIKEQLENRSIIVGDCLDIMKRWKDDGIQNVLDLVYIDPPFNSKRDYNLPIPSDTLTSEEAFKDTWSNTHYLDEMDILDTFDPDLREFIEGIGKFLPGGHTAYLTTMALRVWLARYMLKPTGSFYYHCDPTMSHYIKMLLDQIFGIKNFRNEIVWRYNKWTNNTTSYQKNHDIILWYSKTDEYIYNTQFAMTERTAKSYEKGYGTNVANGKKQVLIYDENKCDIEEISKKYQGYSIVYVPDRGGVAIADWWDIPILNSQAKERLGYPTQKPEKLMERIIKASSNEEDLVADFFAGGGTTGAVAERINRKWIMSDINHRAVYLMKDRISNYYRSQPGGSGMPKINLWGVPSNSTELKTIVESKDEEKTNEGKFYLQDAIIKCYLSDLMPNNRPFASKKKTGDHSVDGTFVFDLDGKRKKGIIQVTAGSNINHFKSFCEEVNKYDMGIYIAFEDKPSNSWFISAKEKGKIGGVDKLQILTIEDIVDRKKGPELPAEYKGFF